MKKKYQKIPKGDDLRLSPEKRLCNQVDATSLQKEDDKKRGEMGVPVLDNCVQEHTQ